LTDTILIKRQPVWSESVALKVKAAQTFQNGLKKVQITAGGHFGRLLSDTSNGTVTLSLLKPHFARFLIAAENVFLV